MKKPSISKYFTQDAYIINNLPKYQFLGWVTHLILLRFRKRAHASVGIHDTVIVNNPSA